MAQAALVLLLVLAVVAGWLLWDNRRLDVTTHQVTLEQLPASASGTRIVQVSDLHGADFGTFQARLLDAVRAAEPDLIALTGDYIDHTTGDLTAVLDLAEEFTDIAPVVAVIGNHEIASPRMHQLLEGLSDRGVRVLRDESTPIELGGAEVSLVGLDDPWLHPPALRDDFAPDRVMAGLELPAGIPTIVLAHRPELLEDYAAAGADLVLSGHAHGGQVRVPGIGGLYAPHQGWLPELTAGVHHRGGTAMVVSRGLGNSAFGVRVHNPRELVVVELLSAAG